MKIPQKAILSFILGIILTLILVFIYCNFPDKTKAISSDKKDSEYFTLKETLPGEAPDSPDATWFNGPWVEKYQQVGKNKVSANASIKCFDDICILTIVSLFKDNSSTVDSNIFSYPFSVVEKYKEAGRIIAEAEYPGDTTAKLVIDYNSGTIELFEKNYYNNNPDFVKVGEMILKPSMKMYPFKKNN